MAVKSLKAKLDRLTELFKGEEARTLLGFNDHLIEINATDLSNSMVQAWKKYNQNISATNPSLDQDGNKVESSEQEIKDGMFKFSKAIIAGYNKTVPTHKFQNNLKFETTIDNSDTQYSFVLFSTKKNSKLQEEEKNVITAFRALNNKITQPICNKKEFSYLFTTDKKRFEEVDNKGKSKSRFFTKGKDGGDGKVRLDIAHGEGVSIYEFKESLYANTVDAAAAGEDIDGMALSSLPSEIQMASKGFKETFGEVLLIGNSRIDVKEKAGSLKAVSKIRISVESQTKNLEDKKKSELKKKSFTASFNSYKDMVAKAIEQNIANKKSGAESWGAEAEASKSPMHLIGEMIVNTPIKKAMYKKKLGMNLTTFKSKAASVPEKSVNSKKTKLSTKRKQYKGIPMPTSKMKGPPPKKDSSKEGGRQRGPEQDSQNAQKLLTIRNAINAKLPSRIKQNMGGSALSNRSGRFAESARIEQVSPAAKTLMIKYTYRLNPYETFENTSKRRWPTGYNPKPLIAKSIRQLALEMAGIKMITTRRV